MKPFQVNWIEHACGAGRWSCPIGSYICSWTSGGKIWAEDLKIINIETITKDSCIVEMTHGDYQVWKLTEGSKEGCSLEYQDLRNEVREKTQRRPRKKRARPVITKAGKGWWHRSKKMGRVPRSVTSKTSQELQQDKKWNGSFELSSKVVRYLWAALARALE